MAAAGKVEAEADLVLRQPLRPAAGERRAGDQARDREEDAERDDKADEPDFPAGKFEHVGPQSFAGFAFARQHLADAST